MVMVKVLKRDSVALTELIYLDPVMIHSCEIFIVTRSTYRFMTVLLR